MNTFSFHTSSSLMVLTLTGQISPQLPQSQTDRFDVVDNADVDDADVNDVDEDCKVGAVVAYLASRHKMQRLHPTFVSLITILLTHFHSSLSFLFSSFIIILWHSLSFIVIHHRAYQSITIDKCFTDSQPLFNLKRSVMFNSFIHFRLPGPDHDHRQSMTTLQTQAKFKNVMLGQLCTLVNLRCPFRHPLEWVLCKVILPVCACLSSDCIRPPPQPKP